MPPRPAFHTSPGDRQITIGWDNQPEILLRAGLAGAEGFQFAGYRVYRLSNWSRQSEVPADPSWELIGAFGPDTLNRQKPLASVTDSTVDWDLIEYGNRHYPIGRYRVVDPMALNGFDYLYAVTTVSEKRIPVGTGFKVLRLESRIESSLDSMVVAHSVLREYFKKLASATTPK